MERYHGTTARTYCVVAVRMRGDFIICHITTHERVERYTRIKVRYQDEDFHVHEEWVEGFLARVMQHEFDHLEGKMFIDHLPVLRKQMIAGKLKAMLKGKFRCNYRTKVAKK